MMIEPINSAMTYQAQAITPVAAASQAETKEGSQVQVDAPKVDDTTLVVDNAKLEEDAENGEQQSQANQQNKQVDDDLIRKAMRELNKKNSNVIAEFGIHEGTNRITVKMVDRTSKKVIKELPPEKTLDMIAKVWEYAGLIVDEKR